MIVEDKFYVISRNQYVLKYVFIEYSVIDSSHC